MKSRDMERLKFLLKRYAEETGNSELKRALNYILSEGNQRRRAGRKLKFSSDINCQIHDLRSAGKTIREIASITGCSVGYIQKQLSGKQYDSPE